MKSAEMNKMIRAVNAGKENPFKDRADCKRFFADLLSEKADLEKRYPGKPVVFGLVDADEDEEAELMSLLPD